MRQRLSRQRERYLRRRLRRQDRRTEPHARARVRRARVLPRRRCLVAARGADRPPRLPLRPAAGAGTLAEEQGLGVLGRHGALGSRCREPPLRRARAAQPTRFRRHRAAR